ncbi:HD domain-containing protein [Saccharothrix luteola]|uniref:HD domain-containing protein n=1 Tax=Saccharothrix luteola TaxID=2893018 RepID=UPI0022A86AF1|nr:HD domain-containing protein [Saccharothrix luteola]MCC8248032.1 HD domain-containing protein [Saccharothrix luteola]
MENAVRGYALARECLELALPRRWAHVQGVARRARSLAQMFPPEDVDYLIAAAVLHDIGYSPNLALTGFHPLDGARYLEQLGLPRRLCALVAHHSCACLEAELRGMSAELALWEDERSAVRDALWWADMTTTPDGGLTNLVDRIDEIQRRYGAEDLVTFFIRQATPELVAAVDRTQERLRAAGLGHLVK